MEQIGGARPAYQLRLRHLLQPRARLSAICDKCGETRQLNALKLVEEYGDLELPKLQDRLYCRTCRSRKQPALTRLRIEWLSDPHAPGVWLCEP